MSPSRRSPRSFSIAFERIQHDLAPHTTLGQVQQAWLGVVGPAIAQEASPVRERGGVLTVSCSASVWAQELELMSEEILARLNASLEDAQLSRIRCTAVPIREEL